MMNNEGIKLKLAGLTKVFITRQIRISEKHLGAKRTLSGYRLRVEGKDSKQNLSRKIYLLKMQISFQHSVKKNLKWFPKKRFSKLKGIRK